MDFPKKLTEAEIEPTIDWGLHKTHKTMKAFKNTQIENTQYTNSSLMQYDIPAAIFNEAAQAGDWDETARTLRECGYDCVGGGEEHVHPDSYQTENAIVVIGGQSLNVYVFNRAENEAVGIPEFFAAANYKKLFAELPE